MLPRDSHNANGLVRRSSCRTVLSQLAPAHVESMMGKQVKLVACGRSFTVATVTHGWVPDKQAPDCMACKKKFTQVRRRVRSSHSALAFVAPVLCQLCIERLVMYNPTIASLPQVRWRLLQQLLQQAIPTVGGRVHGAGPRV